MIHYSSNASAAQSVEAEIRSHGGSSIVLQADLSDPSSIGPLFERAVSHFGHLDIVVSNAGIECFGHISEITPADFDRVFALNTRGQLFVAQQAYRHVVDGGRLVLMGSISAQSRGVKNHAIYQGSKAAIEAFARSLAVGA